MKSVFMQKRFRKYWFSYKDTDLRAQVIKNGELKFSKVLKKCIRSLTDFRALYNSEGFITLSNLIVQGFSEKILVLQ